MIKKKMVYFTQTQSIRAKQENFLFPFATPTHTHTVNTDRHAPPLSPAGFRPGPQSCDPLAPVHKTKSFRVNMNRSTAMHSLWHSRNSSVFFVDKRKPVSHTLVKLPPPNQQGGSASMDPHPRRKAVSLTSEKSKEIV